MTLLARLDAALGGLGHPAAACLGFGLVMAVLAIWGGPWVGLLALLAMMGALLLARIGLAGARERWRPPQVNLGPAPPPEGQLYCLSQVVRSAGRAGAPEDYATCATLICVSHNAACARLGCALTRGRTAPKRPFERVEKVG